MYEYFLILFLSYYNISKQLGLCKSNYIYNKKFGFNYTTYSSKNSTQYGKKTPVKDNEIKGIDATPEISIKFHQLLDK